MKILKTITLFAIMLILSLTAASCSKGIDGVPSGMKKLSNDFSDFNMYIPEAWVIVSDDSTGYLSAYVSENDRSNITVTAFETEGRYDSLAGFWEYYKSDFEAAFSEMTVESEDNVTLDGYEARAYTYTAITMNVRYKYIQLICIRGETVYLITYHAVPELFAGHVEQFWYIIDKFNFK